MGTFSKPVWIEQGPGPLALPMAGYSIAAGAIQAVAADPVVPDRVFVATCGGGIWRSDDAISAKSPTWIPLTDHLPTLSMSAIAFDPLDPQRNTLWAGSGATSHSAPLVGSITGPLFGLYKTTNGGQTWIELGRPVFQGISVNRILPTMQTTAGGSVILVATSGRGLQRSADGGLTWKKIGAGIGNAVRDVVTDPTNPLRVYVASMAGVFRSDDGGDTKWTKISAGLSLPASPLIELSVSRTVDTNNVHRLYAVVQNIGLFFSSDFGATWKNMGLPPDAPGPSKPAAPMSASPINASVAFCTSDNGKHWLVNGTQWTQLDLAAAAANTAPHTDGRGCAFSADGNTWFETDDGGIYRLVNAHGLPGGTPRRWEAAVGNIRVAEFHSIAYDSVNHILFGATQDNCIPQQTAPGSIDWKNNEDPYGDGFQVEVDDTSTPGASIHYSSQQLLFHARRRTYTSPTTVTMDVGLGLVIRGTGGVHYNVFEGAILNDGSLGTVRWNQSFALNRADPTRMLLGTDFLYESFDRGDSFDALGGIGKNAQGEPIPINPVGTVSAYAYGHPTNTDVIWLGAGGKLLLRSGGLGLPTAVTSYPGSTPIDVALAAHDWRRAYVLDSNNRVWRTGDAGETPGEWAELTGNLPSLSGDLRTLEVFRSATPSGEHVFVGGQGGVYVTSNPHDGTFAFWQKHGTNLPNAIVTDIHYSSKDDVLVAGTLGRAAFAMQHVRDTLVGGPRLSVLHSGSSSCFGGWTAGTDVLFYPLIDGYGFLAQPLKFGWHVVGAAKTTQFIDTQIVVTMPPPGQRVDVMLTVTDATGYKLFAYKSDVTLSAVDATKRAALCALIDKIKHEAILNWPIDPLSPPIRVVDYFDRSSFASAAVLFTRAARQLEAIARTEKDVAARTAAAPSQELVAAWHAAYPHGELANWSVPTRVDEARRVTDVTQKQGRRVKRRVRRK